MNNKLPMINIALCLLGYLFLSVSKYLDDHYGSVSCVHSTWPCRGHYTPWASPYTSYWTGQNLHCLLTLTLSITSFVALKGNWSWDHIHKASNEKIEVKGEPCHWIITKPRNITNFKDNGRLQMKFCINLHIFFPNNRKIQILWKLKEFSF